MPRNIYVYGYFKICDCDEVLFAVNGASVTCLLCGCYWPSKAILCQSAQESE